MFNVCFSRATVCRIVFDLSARADRVSSGSFTSPLFCFPAVHSVGMNGLFTTTSRLHLDLLFILLYLIYLDGSYLETVLLLL